MLSAAFLARLPAVEAELQCPLCSEVMTEPHTVTQCHHDFCFSCISDSLDSKSECPVCHVPAWSSQIKRHHSLCTIIGLYHQLCALVSPSAGCSLPSLAPVPAIADAATLSPPKPPSRGALLDESALVDSAFSEKAETQDGSLPVALALSSAPLPPPRSSTSQERSSTSQRDIVLPAAETLPDDYGRTLSSLPLPPSSPTAAVADAETQLPAADEMDAETQLPAEEAMNAETLSVGLAANLPSQSPTSQPVVAAEGKESSDPMEVELPAPPMPCDDAALKSEPTANEHAPSDAPAAAAAENEVAKSSSLAGSTKDAAASPATPRAKPALSDITNSAKRSAASKEPAAKRVKRPATWECSACTFINPRARTSCEICLRKRRAGTPEVASTPPPAAATTTPVGTSTARRASGGRSTGSQSGKRGRKLVSASPHSQLTIHAALQSARRQLNVASSAASSDGDDLLDAAWPAAVTQETAVSQAAHAASPPVCILLSGVTDAQRRIVELRAPFVDVHRLVSCAPKVESGAVTHVVTGVDESLHCRRTLKYLVAILRGWWVVSVDWVLKSIERGQWLPESDFEVTGDMVSGETHAPRRARQQLKDGGQRLFEGRSVYLHGDFVNPPREDLAELLTFAGADLTQRRAKDEATEQLWIYDKSIDLSLARNAFLKNAPNAASSAWLLTCIATYQVQPIVPPTDNEL